MEECSARRGELAAALIPARRDARVRSPREYGAPSRSRAQTGDGDDPVTATRAASDPEPWMAAIIEFFNEVADLKRKEKQTAEAAQADAQAAQQLLMSAMNKAAGRAARAAAARASGRNARKIGMTGSRASSASARTATTTASARRRRTRRTGRSGPRCWRRSSR